MSNFKLIKLETHVRSSLHHIQINLEEMHLNVTPANTFERRKLSCYMHLEPASHFQVMDIIEAIIFKWIQMGCQIILIEFI